MSSVVAGGLIVTGCATFEPSGIPVSDVTEVPEVPEVGVLDVCVEAGYQAHSPVGTELYRFFPEEESWRDAVLACNETGGRLAIIDSLSEHELVSGLVGENNAWIGLSDINLEDEFVWVDGQPLDELSMAGSGYPPWDPDEPNDNLFGQDCVQMRFERGLRWDDEACSIRKAFVCECGLTTFAQANGSE